MVTSDGMVEIEDIKTFVLEKIEEFRELALKSIDEIKFEFVKNRNPYLILSCWKAGEFLFHELESKTYASMESLFGNILEDILIRVIEIRFGRVKYVEGVKLDVEFVTKDRSGLLIHNLMEVKSSVNWGNSAQHAQLHQRFLLGKKEVKNKRKGEKFAVTTWLGITAGGSGIGHGRRTGCKWVGGKWVGGVQTCDYQITGQTLWTMVSGGNEDLYLDLASVIESVEGRKKFTEARHERLKAGLAEFIPKSKALFQNNPTKLVEWHSGNLPNASKKQRILIKEIVDKTKYTIG